MFQFDENTKSVAKNLGLAFFGNLIGSTENFISFLVMWQLVKKLDGNESPVDEGQIFASGIVSIGLFFLSNFVSYYLLRINKNDQKSVDIQNVNALEYEPTENSFLIIESEPKAIPRSKKIAAQATILISGGSQFLLDFAGLSSALITRWPKPKGFLGAMGYGLFLLLFSAIASSHAIVVGKGETQQSMRKAGYFERSAASDSRWIRTILNILTPIPLVFMTLAAYSGGVFNSVLNLLIFYGENNLGSLARYTTGLLVTLLLFPMLMMDYAVVATKVIYTYWSFGFGKEVPQASCKSPLFTTLKFLHDNTYLRLFNFSKDNHFDQYDRSLYWSKMITRCAMLSGFFYNLMEVFLAKNAELHVSEYPEWSWIPLISLPLAALSALLEYRQFSYVPVSLAEEYHAKNSGILPQPPSKNQLFRMEAKNSDIEMGEPTQNSLSWRI